MTFQSTWTLASWQSRWIAKTSFQESLIKGRRINEESNLPTPCTHQ